MTGEPGHNIPYNPDIKHPIKEYLRVVWVLIDL